ncbi:MAG: DUF3298 domain-containing protein, partial [Sphingobacterium sp.]
GLMLVSIFKKRGFAFILFSTILAVLFSCQSTKQDRKQGNNNANNHVQDTLTYKIATVKEISPYFSQTEDKIDTTYVKVTYPEFTDDGMNKLVLQNILIDGESTVKQYALNFLEGYGNFIEENIVQNPIAWKKETAINIDLYTPEIISIQNQTYEFSGGAHGNSFRIWNIYELESGRKLDLKTFIPENKMLNFVKTVEKKFRSDEGISDTTNLDKNYFFEDGKFALSATFGLTKTGIMFHYNPYEIKPYSAGTTTLIMDYNDIQEFLTNTGKNYIQNIKTHYKSIQ